MSPSFADGCRPERTSLSAILYDLQACISEPAIIFHYWTRNLVRRLWKLARETGTDGDTVDAAFKGTGTGTGTAGKESPPAQDNDYNQQQADDGHESNPDDDSQWSIVSYSEEEEEEEEDDDPPSYRICYDGVSNRLFLAYSISRYLVELLAVRPRFPFVGACDHRSTYYSSSERGHTDSNLDSQGNLILHSEDFALEDGFSIEIKCLDRDCGFFSFTLDPFHCNDIITHTIRTTRSRQIELTFIPLHNAIPANV